MDNKKKRNTIILIVALVLLIGSGMVCLVNVLDNRDKGTGNKVDGATVVMVADTEEKTTNTTTEKVTTEKATTESNTSSKSKDTENASTEHVVTSTQSTEVPSTTQSIQATTSAHVTTQAPATTEKEKVWHPAVTEMVWVVDKESWTETIPVYETREGMKCHGCGQVFCSSDTLFAHEDISAYDECGGWSSCVEQVQVGTTEVNHEEEGHWEEVVVQEGCWE